jgi:hypothetical protein
VFLSETLEGERIALEAIDDRWYTVYFADFPLAQFDSRTRTIHRLRPAKAFDIEDAGEGELECTPKVRHEIKGPATLNGGEACWCPDNSIPVN